MSAPLAELRPTLLRVPLTRPWADDVTTITVIAVDIRDAEGAWGHGFSWTPSRAGTAVHALLADDIATFALGRSAHPGMWRAAWEHLHEAGSGGVTTIALAGLDTALWDLEARRAGVGLADLLGRRHDRQPTYGSGVNLHYSQGELVAQAQRWVDAGFTAVKIKVGRPMLAEDIARVRAVREVIGPGRALMLDANQRWDLDAASRAIEALSAYDIAWFEEPLRADDIAGHALLRRRTGARIALGENLHTVYRFREAIDAGAVDVAQPNAIRVGGISPFLEIVEVARGAGVEVAPHLLLELSAQLAFAMRGSVWVEDVEDARFEQLGALARPTGLAFDAGWVTGGPTLGLGLRFATGVRT